MKELVKARKFRTIDSVMNDPISARRLSEYIDEAVGCKVEIAKQQQKIKDLAALVADELKLDPKMFRVYMAAAFNNDYAVRLQGAQNTVDMLQRIIMTLPGGLDAYLPPQDDDGPAGLIEE